MDQKFLDGPDVVAVLQEVGGEGVLRELGVPLTRR